MRTRSLFKHTCQHLPLDDELFEKHATRSVVARRHMSRRTLASSYAAVASAWPAHSLATFLRRRRAAKPAAVLGR